MLPLSERLKRPSLFARAYSARKSVATPIFTLYVLPRSSPKQVLPMVGFVVSKKISKSACQRNKMKRRLREAYRKVTGSMSENTGAGNAPLRKLYAVVLVIREGMLKTSWSDTCTTMENALLEAARRYG
jgi:ribonuclease P protein component